MRTELDLHDLDERIARNESRLQDDLFSDIKQAFRPADYDWYADMEGRILLAHLSHSKMSGKRYPIVEAMLAELPARLNEKGYMGPVFDPQIHEQQLSGHSWLLRGLCEYYDLFGDETVLALANTVVEHLYLPLCGRFTAYPTDRAVEDAGGAVGEFGEVNDGWILSTDIGCAFMSIDGLSHVFEITRDPRIKTLLDEMIGVYIKIDKEALKAQTHCTLTAARGMIRMYHLTEDVRYLEGAKSICALYVKSGMTDTYHNINWWGRRDTFSEPCAIVDALMLATELYKATGDTAYRTLAARTYHNAFSIMQRSNGGAGTDRLVCEGGVGDLGAADIYEAWWCCSMRLAEGLWYARENAELLYAETAGTVTKNENGVYADGDILYGELPEEFRHYAAATVTCDGHVLSPIPRYIHIPEADATRLRMQMVF